jgi:hypothetical protein
MKSDKTRAIWNIIEQYGPKDPTLIDAPTTLPLALPSFGQAEIAEAMDALLSGWLTMGNRVFEFERRWAEYIGVKESIAVNSGSSALKAWSRSHCTRCGVVYVIVFGCTGRVNTGVGRC